MESDWWDVEHPFCESCKERGCFEIGCAYCDLDGLVMLTDGLIFHPLCLAREQAADAAFGNVEYRGEAVPLYVEAERAGAVQK